MGDRSTGGSTLLLDVCCGREFPAVASSSTEAEGTEALFLKGASACLKPRENP
jgi:hypothetical protein